MKSFAQMALSHENTLLYHMKNTTEMPLPHESIAVMALPLEDIAEMALLHENQWNIDIALPHKKHCWDGPTTWKHIAEMALSHENEYWNSVKHCWKFLLLWKP